MMKIWCDYGRDAPLKLTFQKKFKATLSVR